MDKLNSSGRTITIKINGEDHSFREGPANQVDFEHILDESHQELLLDSTLPIEEAAATQELVEESFDWIIPETDNVEISEYKLAETLKGKKNPKKNFHTSSVTSLKKKGSVLKSIFLATIFAILIGTSFGVLMLKLVIADHGKTNLKTIEATAPAINEVETPKSSPVSVTLPPFTPNVVQGGIFSTREAARTASDQLKAKGAPAIIMELNAKNYLFLGVSDSIDLAKGLGSNFKENGITEVYAKPLPFEEKKVEAKAQIEKEFLDLAPSVFQMLSEVTSSAIVTSVIPSESMTTISKMESKMLKNQNDQKLSKTIKDLKYELVTTMAQIHSYQNSKDKKNLKNAQQHLLNYLLLYNSL